MCAVLFGSRFCAGSSFEFKASLNPLVWTENVWRTPRQTTQLNRRIKNLLRIYLAWFGKWTLFERKLLMC
jgi:hypothetical protein